MGNMGVVVWGGGLPPAQSAPPGKASSHPNTACVLLTVQAAPWRGGGFTISNSRINGQFSDSCFTGIEQIIVGIEGFGVCLLMLALLVSTLTPLKVH